MRKGYFILLFWFLIMVVFIVLYRQSSLFNRSPKASEYRTLTSPGNPIHRKIYVLIYNPTLSNGKKLVEHLRWNNPDTLTAEAIGIFKEITNNRIDYSVAYRTEVNNVWLRKIDNFTYTEQQYLDVITQGAPHHEPDIADYYQFINNPAFDICGKLNRGEIDELWVWGGPWFGFNESRLVGPGGFEYNSSPITTGTSCTKLLPVMGLSYETGADNIIHDFGHRTEATMTHLYGSWEQNRASHNWDRFGLEKVHSPSYGVTGCGSVHFTPNATTTSHEYRYDLPTEFSSYCDSFYQYPDLNFTGAAITCQSWGCTALGYYKWWFKHIPSFSGTAPDGKLNDWWQYITDPNKVLTTEGPPPVISAVPTANPSVSLCSRKTQGDANCDESIDLIDFELFRKEFMGILSTKTADFNQDARVDRADYEIWSRSFRSNPPQ